MYFFHNKKTNFLSVVKVEAKASPPSLQVLSVDTDRKTVAFDDGLVQNYDQLLISTGCRYILNNISVCVQVFPSAPRPFGGH